MRFTALVLAAVLATACAHDRPLTNRDVTAYAAWAVMFGGAIALCVRYDSSCKHIPWP